MLTDQIIARRTSGRVTCVLVAQPQWAKSRLLADQAVESVGFRALGDGWLEVSESDARRIGAGVLGRDLATNAVIIPALEADDLVGELLAMVPEPFTCFTNGDWADVFGDDAPQHDGFSFDPLTDSALDAGIVCVGDGVTAVLWVEDEE
ncbi:hypothetical protein [Gemmatimonas sp.]|uniref:hypothetical protein n=1 Tax=Gemmatimonas sp. TaxID=1962908 RepID=UPI00398349BC